MWITHYEIAAIIMMIAILILFFSGKNIHTKISSIFIGIIVTSLSFAIFDEISVYGLTHTDVFSPVLNSIILVLYNLSATSALALYTIYVIYLTRNDITLRNRGIKLVMIPIAVETLLMVTSPFTHLMYYIDADGRYHRGPLMTQWFIVTAMYLVFMAYMAVSKIEYLTRLQFASVAYYTIATFLALVLQMFFPEYLLEAFGVAIGVVLTYISMQGEFIDSDRILGTYNNEALAKKIESSIGKNQPFHIVVVRVGGFDKLNAVFGYEVANDILRQIGNFLMKLIPEHQVFHLTGLFFACYVEGDDDTVKYYADVIAHRFGSRFITGTTRNEILFPFGIGVISCPEHANNAMKVSAIMNMILPEPTMGDSGKIVYVDEKIVKQYDRNIQVERAVERAIRNGTFDVHYQPIIDMASGKVRSAEALVRLHDIEYGDIYPDEFIPLAERNGSISEITMFVLGRVCDFIRRGGCSEKGLDFIEVNLSASECMRNGTAERLIGVLKSYDIDPRHISFEITETAATGGNTTVLDNLNKLTAYGIKFALDDYGTGYSNLSELVALPFDIVKIDRSVLWMAAEEEDAMRVLKSVLDLVHEIGAKIVIEGVEDDEHVAILRANGVEYAQGYYYSKPIPQNEFIEYVNDINVFGAGGL